MSFGDIVGHVTLIHFRGVPQIHKVHMLYDQWRLVIYFLGGGAIIDIYRLWAQLGSAVYKYHSTMRKQKHQRGFE